MEETKVFETLAKSDNPVIAILSALIIILAGIVVYQWRYTMTKTVPKWLWDNLNAQVSKIVDLQEKMNFIINERLKK